MINIVVGVITAIAFGILIFWALRPAAREWFEFPKYKMLEDDSPILMRIWTQARGAARNSNESLGDSSVFMRLLWMHCCYSESTLRAWIALRCRTWTRSIATR
jgi:hypothetical protein